MLQHISSLSGVHMYIETVFSEPFHKPSPMSVEIPSNVAYLFTNSFEVYVL